MISFENFIILEIATRKSDFAACARTIIYTHAHIAGTICIKISGAVGQINFA